jgi:hypothetical protein
MKTVQITPAEMEARIARFRSTTPQSGYYADSGIPKEAYELMTAKSLYLMMAPPHAGRPDGGETGDRRRQGHEPDRRGVSARRQAAAARALPHPTTPR